MEGSGGPKRIGTLVSRVLARHGYTGASSRGELEAAWNKIVDEESKPYTRVGYLKQGTLEILVDNSMVLQRLEGFQKTTLLEELQQALPKHGIQKLKFRRR